MTQLLNFEDEDSQPVTQADLKRIENKLDRLADHLGVDLDQDGTKETR